MAADAASPASPRVVYGPGAVARLPAELGRLHVSAPLIVASPSRVPLARRIQALLPNLDARILDSAAVAVDGARDRFAAGRDVVVSVGGASAVGLARAVARRKGIPHVCVPTTYSGSEAMPPRRGAGRGHGRAASRSKASGNRGTARDPRILPAVVIYDEELTTSVPKRFSAPSDAAAMARSAESRACRSSKGDDDAAQWSYIHLPGV